MTNTPTPEPQSPSRDVLMTWLRGTCPDLQLRTQRLEDGRLACLARFSIRGERLEVESIVADDAPIGAVEEVLRRATRVVYQKLQIPTPPLAGEVDERSKRELEIVAAALRGDTELADRLGRELVMKNEGITTRAPIRARFEI